MNMERPYQPSPEEHASAQKNMTEEQQQMTKEREEALEGEVIEALTAKGAKSPETKATLVRWLEMGEAEANLIGTGKARVEFAIQAASVYHRAGYFDEALAELESTEEAAANEDFELYDKIIELKRKIEGGTISEDI